MATEKTDALFQILETISFENDEQKAAFMTALSDALEETGKNGFSEGEGLARSAEEAFYIGSQQAALQGLLSRPDQNYSPEQIADMAIAHASALMIANDALKEDARRQQDHQNKGT